MYVVVGGNQYISVTLLKGRTQVVSEYLMNCLAEPLTSWFPVICASWMICPFMKESESVSHFSHFCLFATAWTVAHQGPLCMGFSRQEYWSELPFPSPGDLPYPGIEPGSSELRADSLPAERVLIRREDSQKLTKGKTNQNKRRQGQSPYWPEAVSYSPQA